MTTARIVKRLIAAIAIAVGAITSIALAAILALQTETGASLAARTLSGLLSQPPATTITIDGLRLRGISEISVESVALSDESRVWTRLRGIEIAWQPGEILAGRLTLDSLHIDELAVSNPPELGKAPEANSALSQSWLPTAVESLRVERFAIEHPQLAVPVEGSARGHVRIGRDEADGELEASWRSGANGSAHFVFAFGDAGQPLTLFADVRDGAGGFLSRLMGFPDGPEIGIQLAGYATPERWTGNVIGIVSDNEFLNADISIVPGETYDVTIDGSLALPPDITETIASAPLGRLTLTASAAVHPGQAIRNAAIRAGLDTLQAEATGELDLESLEVAARFGISATDLSAIPATQGRLGGSVSVSGSLTGPVLSPRVTGTFGIHRPIWQSGRAETVTGDFNIAGPSDDGTKDWVANLATQVIRPEFGVETLDRLLGETITITAAASFNPFVSIVQSIDVSIVGSLAEGRAVASQPQEGLLELSSVRLTVRDAEPMAPLVGLAVGGELVAEGNARVRLADGLINGRGQIRGNKFRWGDDNLDAVLGGDPTIGGEFAYEPSRGTEISTIRARGQHAEATGRMAFSPSFEALTSELTVTVPSLDGISAFRNRAIAGSVTAEARLTGPVDKPKLDLTVTSPALTVGDQPVERLRLQATANNLMDDPTGQWSLSALWQGEVVNVSAHYRLQEGAQVSLTDVRAEGFAGVAQGTLSVNVSRGIAEGQLVGTFPALARLSSLSGMAASGEAEIRLRLAAAGGVQTAAAELRIADLDVKDFALSAVNASAEAEVTDPFGTPRGSIGIEVSGLGSGPVSAQRWTLAIDGTPNAASYRTALTGQGGAPLDLRSAGTVSWVEGGLHLSVESLEGSYANQPLRANQPFRLDADTARIALEGFELSLGEGRLSASAIVGAETLQAAITAHQVPLDMVAALAPEFPLEGTVDASLTTEGPRQAPHAEGTLRLSGVRPRLAGYEDLPAIEIVGSMTLDGTRAVLNVESKGLADQPLVARLVLPVSADGGPLGVAVVPTGPIDGTFDGTVDLGYLAPFVTAEGDALRGTIRIQGGVTGLVRSPQPSGRLTFGDGYYENAATGLVLKNIQAFAEADGSAVHLRTLKADDGTGGTLQGSGHVSYAETGSLPFDLSLAMQGLTVVRKDGALATVDGPLHLAGNRDGASLEGRITVHSAEIRIPERLPTMITDLDVVEINAPPTDQSAEKRRTRRRGAYPVELGLAIDLPGRAFVRGRGLDSEWRGQFAVAGTVAAPVVTGSVSLVRGSFDLLGKMFVLDRGRVEVPEGTSPVLDVSGEAVKRDLAVRVTVHGPVSSPAIDLTSRPEFPPDEVLARLLFDKQAGQLTAFEAVQLANAAAVLSGRGGGTDLLDKVRRRLGVDRLSVSPGAEGVDGASVNVGKYVAEGVFVSVGSGAQAGTERVKVEIEVTPNVSVETDVGADARSRVGVNWRWEY